MRTYRANGRENIDVYTLYPKPEQQFIAPFLTESLPSFAFQLKSRQEYQLKAKHFLPPVVSECLFVTHKHATLEISSDRCKQTSCTPITFLSVRIATLRGLELLFLSVVGFTGACLCFPLFCIWKCFCYNNNSVQYILHKIKQLLVPVAGLYFI